MSAYTVPYRCGHEATLQIDSKDAARETTIAWIMLHHCPDCESRIIAEQKTKVDVVERKMHFSDYKNHFADCATKLDSYDAESKTIVVLIPKTPREKVIAQLIDAGMQADKAEAFAAISREQLEAGISRMQRQMASRGDSLTERQRRKINIMMACSEIMRAYLQKNDGR